MSRATGHSAVAAAADTTEHVQKLFMSIGLSPHHPFLSVATNATANWFFGLTCQFSAEYHITTPNHDTLQFADVN